MPTAVCSAVVLHWSLRVVASLVRRASAWGRRFSPLVDGLTRAVCGLESGRGSVALLLLSNPLLYVAADIPESVADNEAFGSPATVAHNSKALLAKTKAFSDLADKQQVVGVVHFIPFRAVGVLIVP
jgi:hypothetical protein